MIQKNHLLFLLLMISITLASCCSDNDQQTIGEEVPQTRFVVDKIYNFDDLLMAEYFYNDNNQLVKRSAYDPVSYPGIKIMDSEFDYEGDRIANIRNINYTHPGFSHNIVILYDQQGKIVADETYQLGNRIERKDYLYNNNGQVKSFITMGLIENFFVDYQGTDNALEVKMLVDVSDSGFGNEYEERFRNFIYDDKQKPDFGIGKVFQFEPMPGYGDEAHFEKNISKNNLIEFENGTKWIHTYNEHNLPATIQIIWKNIETEKPMMYKLIYKEIL